MKIDLPRYQWFIQKHGDEFTTNTYSGSIGTLANQGCINTGTFNYRVCVDTSSNNEREFCLVAEGFILETWSEGGKKIGFECARFENSENGIRESGEWLGKLAAKHGF